MVNSIGVTLSDTLCFLCVKEATDNPPDTHSRLWVARVVRSTGEFIVDLKYSFAPREYVCNDRVRVGS